QPASITLPHLQKLDVRLNAQRRTTAYSDLLRPFRLPSLERFHFTLTENQRPPAELTTVIERLRLDCPRVRIELDYWGHLEIAKFSAPLHFLTSVHARETPVSNS